MKTGIAFAFALVSGVSVSADALAQTDKVGMESAAKASSPSKAPAVPDSFKVGDKICYKYNPKGPAYFENTVNSVTSSEIAWTTELKNAKGKKDPHEEKYASAELKAFLGRVVLVPCN